MIPILINQILSTFLQPFSKVEPKQAKEILNQRTKPTNEPTNAFGSAFKKVYLDQPFSKVDYLVRAFITVLSKKLK